ncbi:cupredoxin domain-containing protein [Candidatus Parcubacteria bacterium]|nr:cupredoxin domain-containing protein [Candidatus Parcubacteria bacterium]
MSNKYFWLAAGIALLIGAGVAYRAFLRPPSRAPVSSGKTVRQTVVARENAWLFDPEVVEVYQGDRVILDVVNEDAYDHGIGIDFFGVSQRMPPKSTITVEFTATQLGDFPFYCSVPCGDGIYKGKKRTHFDMTGHIKVVP